MKTGRVTRTDEGYLRAPARLTRAGVFEYRNAGRTWRELRLPEEVFSADSLASFDLLPLVVNHPVENDGAVDASNAKRLAVGSVGSIARDSEDPNYVSGMILITDGDAVRRVENGERELSCGYFCEREPAAPGSTYKDPITGDATPYDFVQRNIRGNHVAIVPQGRAGPAARILLDHNDAIESNPDGEPVNAGKDHNMKKITIDGISFEVAEAVAQAWEKSEVAAKATLDRLAARADSADGQVKDLTAKLAIATDAKLIASQVSARVSLEQTAAKHDVKCDGLDNDAIKRAVVAKIDPSIKLDGKSADYLAAAFDLALARNPVVEQFATPATRTDAAPGDHRSKHAVGFFSIDATERA